MQKLALRIALLLSVLVLLRAGSCLRIERPYPPPTAEALLAAVQAHTRAVNTMRAEARMTHTDPKQKLKATVRMMARRVSDLRFDLVSPFDTPIATLVCHDGRFALVDAQKNRHYHGPASPCNLARLLQVHLPAAEVLTLLTGGAPLIAHDKRSVTWDERAGVEELRLSSSTLEQIIRLDGTKRRWNILSLEIRTRRGETILRSGATDYRAVAGIELPKRIRLEQPMRSTTLELDFKHQEINLALPAVAFELPTASGLPSERVVCP